MKRLTRSVVALGLTWIFICTLGCTTMKNFAKRQNDPYVLYSFGGTKDVNGKTITDENGEVIHFAPHWRNEPLKTTGTCLFHLGLGYLIYDATKSKDEPAPATVVEETPTETPTTPEPEPTPPPSWSSD